MKVNVVYENGVFRPSDKVNLPEKQSLTIHFWPEKKTNIELEKAYAEASRSQLDLEEWETVDVEGWE